MVMAKIKINYGNGGQSAKMQSMGDSTFETERNKVSKAQREKSLKMLN